MKVDIRKWQLDDIQILAKHANNPNIVRNLNDGFPSPYTEKDAEEFIRMVMDSPALFAITVDGEVAGSIGLFLQSGVHRKNAELGYFLAEEYWGKGITAQAVKLTVEYGFSHFDINRIFARPFGYNLASQRVLQKAGFTLEGHFEKTLYRNGEFMDETIYAIRK